MDTGEKEGLLRLCFKIIYSPDMVEKGILVKRKRNKPEVLRKISQYLLRGFSQTTIHQMTEGADSTVYKRAALK